MHILISWLIFSIAFWVTAQLLPGFQIEGFKGAVIAAALFGLLNVLIGWPLLFVTSIIAFPIAWLFPFLIRWFVNAIVLKIVDVSTNKLTIKNFGTAFVAGLIITAIGRIGEYVLVASP